MIGERSLAFKLCAWKRKKEADIYLIANVALASKVLDFTDCLGALTETTASQSARGGG